MDIDTAGGGALVVVLVMALVTLATRWGGVWVMSFVPIGARVRQFISAMSGSVLVALLAPLAWQGDVGARARSPPRPSPCCWQKSRSRPLPLASWLRPCVGSGEVPQVRTGKILSDQKAT